jgi:fibronectin type 3 domain-containing protein
MRYRFTNFTLLAAPGLAAAALVLLLAGCSGSSGSSTPPPIPVAPASLTAAAGNSQITLTWPTVPYASSYNCYWADTAGVTPATGKMVAGVSSPYALTGLTNGTTYYAVVTAKNSSGESPASSPANAMPWITAPASLTATPGNTEVTLTWPAVTGATSYNAYWSGTAGDPKVTGTQIPGVTSPYTQSDLANGSTYYYVVTALDAAGESAESPQATAVPSVLPIPAAPAGLAAAVGSQGVNLTWDTTTNATSYNVYRGTTSGGILTNKTKVNTSPVTAVNYTDTTVANATIYYYQVTAVNSTGESTGSNEVEAPVINLNGSAWSMTLKVLTNSCNTDIGSVTTFSANITQAAGTTSFSGTTSNNGSTGTFTGSVSGQNVTITGSAPYTASGYAGTLDYQATATWSATTTTITLTGTSANYQFLYKGVTECTGTMSFSGSSTGD